MQTDIETISEPRTEADEELAGLLRNLRFADHHSATGTGIYWEVFARPWAPAARGDCDAQVSIKALSKTAGRADGRGIALAREKLRWIAPALTDGFGSVYFRGLPAGEFHAILAEDGGGESLSHRDAAVPEREGRWLQFDLPDGDTSALLEEIVTGQTCRLVVKSRSAVGVSFVLGRRSGLIKLNPNSGGWRIGTVEIPNKLAVLAGGRQTFEIQPG